MKKEPKYKLEITRQQAKTINAACELAARLGMGQIFDLEDFLPMREDMDWSAWHETTREIKKLLRPFLHEKIRGSIHSYFSILSTDTKESAKVACDIHEVLRHALSWDYAVDSGMIESLDTPRDWKTMSGVNYDPPHGWSGKQLPKIERVEE